MAQRVLARDRTTSPRLTTTRRLGPTGEQWKAGQTSRPALPTGSKSPNITDQDHQASGSTDRGLDRFSARPCGTSAQAVGTPGLVQGFAALPIALRSTCVNVRSSRLPSDPPCRKA